MTDLTTIQLYGLNDQTRTQTTDKNNIRSTLRKFFCFLPPHSKHIVVLVPACAKELAFPTRKGCS